MLREAYDIAAEGRRVMEALMQGFDAFLTPSAPGIAPVGRKPGDPIFNQMWTMLHLPVLGLPLYRAQEHMPLGLSLVSPRLTDRHLLRVGGVVEELLGLDRPLG
jgi:Asp-tRNA(Asn)/Glu-tRNA(Gln) amidotransferase A subunit family amidase